MRIRISLTARPICSVPVACSVIALDTPSTTCSCRPAELRQLRQHLGLLGDGARRLLGQPADIVPLAGQRRGGLGLLGGGRVTSADTLASCRAASSTCLIARACSATALEVCTDCRRESSIVRASSAAPRACSASPVSVRVVEPVVPA